MRIIHCSEMATNKGKSSRGRSCVAGGPNGESCKNTQYTQDVSIHTFPNRSSQPSRHMQWVKFVRRHRPGWQASQSSILCSVHFDESSFTMRQDLARELGIKAILKPDAVPSIDVANNAEESTSFSKREIRQVRGIIDCSFVIQERSPKAAFCI